MSGKVMYTWRAARRMELLAAVLRRPEWSIMTRSAHDSDVTDDVIVSHMHVRYPSAARAGPSRAIWASPVKRTFISTVALSTSGNIHRVGRLHGGSKLSSELIWRTKHHTPPTAPAPTPSHAARAPRLAAIYTMHGAAAIVAAAVVYA